MTKKYLDNQEHNTEDLTIQTTSVQSDDDAIRNNIMIEPIL